MAGIPDMWYEFEDSLPEVPGAPVPSRANYSPANVAPLIEFFAGILGYDKADISFQYENNTPNNASDDIIVSHPNDREYYGEWLSTHKTKSSEMLRYEAAAKKSARLTAFQNNSPANIVYFKRTSS